jgi:hypothetical protein
MAHIRHAETNYDVLLAQGWERWVARDEVKNKVGEVLADWSRKP